MAKLLPTPTCIEERARTRRTPREVFAFLDSPANIARVTPSELAVSIESHPEDLRPGTIFAYRLKRWPLDVSWDTVVSEYQPPEGFKRVKARGFFPKWDYSLRITAAPEGAEIHLGLVYEVPQGLYNSLANTYVIRDAMTELVREQTRAIARALDGEP